MGGKLEKPLEEMNKKQKISIVIPICNEELNIGPLYKEIIDALATYDFEVIFVDDGSTDDSFIMYQKIVEGDERITVIRLQRNFGKAAAYSAGFQEAKGDIVVTMDGDLQDDPSDIPRLLEELSMGFDMVVGWKTTGKSTIVKFILSRILNTFIRIFSGFSLKDMNCPLRAMKIEIAYKLNLYGDLHRYIPYLSGLTANQVSQIPVKNRSRKSGTSKYGFNKYSQGMFDFMAVYLIQRYAYRPMQLFGKIGLLSFVIGFLIDSWLVARFFLGISKIDDDLPTLLLGILLIIIGVLFGAIGLIGEMQLRNTMALNKGLQYTITNVLRKRQPSPDPKN